MSIDGKKKYDGYRFTILYLKNILKNGCKIEMFLYVFRKLQKKKKNVIHIFDHHRMRHISNTTPTNYTYTH